MATFVVKRHVSGDFTINDLGGITLQFNDEINLLLFFTQTEISKSSDLPAALTGGSLQRLDGFGGSVIPAADAFDDVDIQSHISEEFPHHPHSNKTELDLITNAGSGIIISGSERTKLSRIEAGATADQSGAEIKALLEGEPGQVDIDVNTVDGQNASDLLARANHTGTQTVSTISDFNTEVDSRADARIALQKGAVNGLAELDGTGRIPASQLTLSAFEFKGSWNANTNTPTLSSGVGTQGDLYRVSVAGSTNLDGITDWQPNDQVAFDGAAWVKFNNSDAVSSVNGQTGAVVLNTDDVSEGSNLYFTNTRVANAPAVVANTAKVSADGSVGTHSDVTLTSPTDGQILQYSSGTFINVNALEAGPLAKIQNRRTTNLTLSAGTTTQIIFNSKDIETDSNIISVPVANPERVVLEDNSAPVQVVFNGVVQTDKKNHIGTLRCLINGTGSPIPGSVIKFGSEKEGSEDSYWNLNCTFTIPVTLFNPGDYITFEIEMDSGDTGTLQADALVIATQEKGPKGDQGPAGAGSSISVKDEDVLLPNTPFSILNFEGLANVAENGVNQVDISVVIPQATYYDSQPDENQTFTTTPITINLDTTMGDVVPGAFSLASDEITFNYDGFADIRYEAHIGIFGNSGTSSSRTYIELDTGSGYSEVTGSTAYGYHRENNEESTSSVATLTIPISNGDKVRLRAVRNSGSGTLYTRQNATRVTVKRLS